MATIIPLKNSKTRLFSVIPYWILLGLVSLLPIFVFPFGYIPVTTGKLILISIGITLVFISWLIGRLVEGTFVVPKTWILPAGGLIVIVTLLSASFSHAFRASWIGGGFDLNSVLTTIVLVAVLALTSLLFQSRVRVMQYYLAFFISLSVLFLFQFVFLFFPQHLTLGLFTDRTGNLVGSWSDFALIAAMGVLFATLAFELLYLSKIMKIALGVFTVFGLFYLALINNLAAWAVLGICVCIVFIYTMTIRRAALNNKENIDMEIASPEPQEHIIFPVFSFIILIVTLLFVFGNALVGGLTSEKLGISYTDIRPSISTTAVVASHILRSDPILGVGPNQFQEAWAKFKPQAINLTNFWGADFSSGFGTVPSTFVTEGILGFGAWIFLLVLFIIAGVRYAFSFRFDARSMFVVMSTFMLASFLWLMALVSVPGPIGIGFLFFMTGLFVAVLVEQKALPVISKPFLSDPRASFFSMLGIVFLLLVVVVMLYSFTEHAVASDMYGKGVALFNSGGTSSDAERYLVKSAALGPNDLTDRTLSTYYLNELSSQVSASNLSNSSGQSMFQTTFTQAEGYARDAVTYNPTWYTNWVALGNLYQAVVSLGIDGAYTNAQGAYQKAAALAPTNPGVPLIQAQLEFNQNQPDLARTYITQALADKSNYADAYVLLSQIDSAANSATQAITDAKEAIAADPQDSNAFIQLGSLSYGDNDFTTAILALEQAVSIDQNNAQAHYLLGLSYAKAGRTSDALIQFRLLSQAFPASADLKKIIDNLTSGQPALAGVQTGSSVSPVSTTGSTSTAANSETLPTNATSTSTQTKSSSKQTQ